MFRSDGEGHAEPVRFCNAWLQQLMTQLAEDAALGQGTHPAAGPQARVPRKAEEKEGAGRDQDRVYHTATGVR